jgi:hypothetical protein
MNSKARTRPVSTGLLVILLAATVSACQTQAADTDSLVVSRLSGSVTVSAEVDSIADFSGFSVIVGREGLDGIDTLGFALTTSDGRFSTSVEAPGRGIYPLIIAREGSILHVDQIVIADGDSATLNLELPVSRRVRIGGQENAAWIAFQNTRALHNQGLIEVLQAGEVETDRFGGQVMQASGILWGLQETFPGTLGADIAAGESIVMLEDWDDELLIERANQIRANNPSYLEVARAARRAMARLQGQEASIALLNEFRERATSRELRAALVAERAIAYIDSLDEAGARSALADLRREYRGTDWAEWAEEAEYEIENLMPGKPAPALAVRTEAGQDVSLDALRGRYVMVEFFLPESEDFHRQLDIRNALLTAYEGNLTAISLSLQPDDAINEAFLEDRQFPGHYVVLDNGAENEIVSRYNVKVVPSRFLIGPDGRLLGRYIGDGLYAMQSDLAEHLGDLSGEDAS